MSISLLRSSLVSRLATCTRRKVTSVAKEVTPLKRGRVKKPSRFSKENAPSYIYLIENEAIETVTKHLVPDEVSKSVPIIDMYPGPGFVLRGLLEKGVNHVFYRDDGRDEWSYEKDRLMGDYPGRITSVSGMMRDESEGRMVSLNIYDDLVVPNPDGEEQISLDTPLQHIKLYASPSPRYEGNFVSWIMRQYLTRSGVFSSESVDIFVFLSCFEKDILTADFKEKNFLKYVGKSVLMQTVFDLEVLDTIEWTYFFPQIKKRRFYTGEKADYDMAFFMRITPNSQFKEEIPFDLWTDYFFFVQQAMAKRKSHVIPFFQKWFAGSTPKIIKWGIPIHTIIGDLNPKVFFELFKEVSKWPEYDSSLLKMAARNNNDWHIERNYVSNTEESTSGSPDQLL